MLFLLLLLLCFALSIIIFLLTALSCINLDWGNWKWKERLSARILIESPIHLLNYRFYKEHPKTSKDSHLFNCLSDSKIHFSKVDAFMLPFFRQGFFSLICCTVKKKKNSSRINMKKYKSAECQHAYDVSLLLFLKERDRQLH